MHVRQFTLSPNERLKSRKIIEQLFKEGRSFSVFPVRVVYLLKEEAPFGLQAGFSASTRSFKRAVDRNRVKRLLRECYRLQKNELQAFLKDRSLNVSVFFIYTATGLPAYGDAYAKMEDALRRIKMLAEKEGRL